MGDEDDGRAPAAPPSRDYRVDDALLDLAAAGAYAMHDLPAHPGRGDHRRGALRRAPADLAPGREPPARPEGAARAARRGAGVTDDRRPRRGRSAATSSSCGRVARLRRRGRRAARRHGYVVFVAGRGPRRPSCARVVHKSKRAYAHARVIEILEPSPERIEPRADHPGVPVAGAALRAPAGDQAGPGRRGAAADRRPRRATSWSRSSRRSNSGATATSSSTRSGSPAATLVCGFHAPAGGRAVVPIEDCLLASELGNRARELVLAWARGQGLEAWERDGAARTASCAPAPPPTGACGCATSSCARGGAPGACSCGS